MNNRIRKLAVAGLTAAMLATAAPGSAQATHQIGHFVAGAIAGAVIAGALNQNSGPVYAPVPVYTAPAYQCTWRWQTVCDAYTGCYRRKVQVC
ncbi:MAG: hypothetical protein KDJ29_01855 [Hyphomicrobiales bacterium]|nr:hypothetical protein [Hyphomicrobiales bacterium]